MMDSIMTFITVSLNEAFSTIKQSCVIVYWADDYWRCNKGYRHF